MMASIGHKPSKSQLDMKIDKIALELSFDNNSQTLTRTPTPTNFIADNLNGMRRNMFKANPNEPPYVTEEPPEKVFEFLEELGNGSSGQVTKVRHKPSGKICAVKRMRRSGNELEDRRISMDLQVVLACDCENIVSCSGYFIKNTEVWICMELMVTCFDKLIRTRKKPLPERFLGVLAASALKALLYLKESHKIIHRDVKPSNMLINEKGQVKLCDFGISGRLIDSMAKTRSAGCVRYMAPERMNPDQQNYDIRSDVWSLGITLHELATAEVPYGDCKIDFEILHKVVCTEPPSLPSGCGFSNEFKSFISACLTKDYKKRPTYNQLMKHEFIVKHIDTCLSRKELVECGIIPPFVEHLH